MAVGAAVSGPDACSVPAHHGPSLAGATRALQLRKSSADSTPPMAATSATMLAAISPS